MNRRIYINEIYAAIIAGIMFAILISFSPGSSFILFLTIVAILFINRLSNKSKRNFLLAIFLVGFGARVVLTLLTMGWSIFSGHILNYALSYGCPNYNTPYIIDDSGYYTLRSLFTSMYWLGKPMSQYTIKSIVKNPYGFTGFIYILASYFTLFGYSPISSRFINCFLGALTIILVYSIVKNTFDEKSARLSSILVAFLPSIFLWSTTNLKETSFIFTIYVMLWSIIKFQRTRKIYYLIIILLSLWFQSFIRSGYREFSYLLIAALLFYSFCYLVLNLYKKKKIFFVILLFMAIVCFLFFQRNRVNLIFATATGRMLIAQRGAISTGGICYQLVPDEVLNKNNLSGSEFLKMLGNAWLHFLLEPFPWKIKSRSMLFSFPHMIMWYILIPFAILGMGISVRHRLKGSLILLIYFFAIASAFAVMGGNIGTVFRIRDIITPIIAIFSSVGLINTFGSLNLKIADEKTI